MTSKPDHGHECDLPAPSENGALIFQNVFLHVTKICNLHCSYCYFSDRKPLPDEMTTEEFQRLWPELVAILPKKVVFTGGEPLLRDDILVLLRGLREADPTHQIVRCLNSNGHLITPELAERLIGLADEVRVSLDGLAPRNDSNRGTANFEAAMRALETYRAVGFEPKVLVTVTRQTLPDLEELICFLVENRFSSININPFRPLGRGALHSDWCVSDSEITLAMKNARFRFCHDEVNASESSEAKSQGHCGVGRFINIMPNGDVFPCHVLTDREFRCGNVRQQLLSDICRGTGLLGQLAGLDFHYMAYEEPRVVQLTKLKACLGTVFSGSRELAIWRKHLTACGESPDAHWQKL